MRKIFIQVYMPNLFTCIICIQVRIACNSGGWGYDNAFLTLHAIRFIHVVALLAVTSCIKSLLIPLLVTGNLLISCKFICKMDLFANYCDRQRCMVCKLCGENIQSAVKMQNYIQYNNSMQGLLFWLQRPIILPKEQFFLNLCNKCEM